MDREGRPARSDRPAPQLDRRRRGPVGLDPHAANDAVAMRSAKAGPVGSRLGCCRSRAARSSAAVGAASRCSGVSAAAEPAGLLGSLLEPRAVSREPPLLPEPAGAPPARCRIGPGAVPRESASTASASRMEVAAVMPPVRTSVHTPHASRMVATIVARRGPSERRRLATAQATKARLRTGMAKMGNNIPCTPVAIDSWTMRDVANSATIIRTMAPKRSDQGARLKNSHHRTISQPADESRQASRRAWRRARRRGRQT